MLTSVPTSVIAAVVLGSALLAGCGGTKTASAPQAGPVQTNTPNAADTTAAPPQTFDSKVIETPPDATVAPGYSPFEPGKTVVATLLAGEPSLEVFDSATAATSTRKLDRDGPHPLVLVTVGTTANRLLVELPIRPNGSRGWIDRTKVSLASHDYRLVVELTDHRLLTLQAGKKILSVPIGVGKGQTPTPNGTYYITELLKPPTTSSVYGTYAYGLSGFSEVLQRFGDGDGQVGIHGTNDPTSIGNFVSWGCVRLQNEEILDLYNRVKVGTQVIFVD